MKWELRRVLATNDIDYTLQREREREKHHACKIAQHSATQLARNSIVDFE